MDSVRLFFGGDVCGLFGLDTALSVLPQLIQEEQLDFVILNGENVLNGSGIAPAQAQQLFEAGVDVITGGNHSLERFDLRETFGQDRRILRPANYPQAPGSGSITVTKNGQRFTVINLQGRENMRAIDCPFQTADRLLESLPSDTEQKDIVIVDFHAESVQEKEALAYYLDGKVAAVFGSHTHTQTADERILPAGTGYISDAGMIGAYDSIIGGAVEPAIARNLTQIPYHVGIPAKGRAVFCGIIAELSLSTGAASALKRIQTLIPRP